LTSASVEGPSSQVDCHYEIPFRASVCLLLVLSLESPGAIKTLKRDYLADAEAALRRNDPDTAMKSLDAALDENPEQAGAHFWRGRLFAGKNEWDKALADLNEAIRLDPTNSQGYGYRGYVFQKRRDMDAALADFNTAVRLNPQDDWALYCRGLLFGERGDLRTAVGDLDAALDANPNNLAAINARGHVHMLRREPEKAVIDFERAIQFESARSRGLHGPRGRGVHERRFSEGRGRLLEGHRIAPNDAVRECSAGTLVPRSIRMRRRSPISRRLCNSIRRRKVRELAGPNCDGWPRSGTTPSRIMKRSSPTIPRIIERLMGRAAAHYGAGELAKALTDYAKRRSSIRKSRSRSTIMPGCSRRLTKDDVRNGARAVELANQACKITEFKNAAYVDTLAAAYAENGDFANALKWQEQAVKLSVGEPVEVQQEMKDRVALYKEQKPYREELKQ
jgi:tetratricopeptide (TPR) repeat protein